MPGAALDIRRFAQAIRQGGIDTRHWVSYGTVGTVDDDGTVDFTDRRAVYVGPQGVECDVILEPLNIHVCAVYAGIAGGRETSFFAPIKPGDRVVVTLPDGDPTVPPVIVAILHSADDRMPVADGAPIFKNDKVFLQTETVDIDIRTRAGGRVLIQQDGTVTTTGVTVNETADHVNLGGPSATEQLVQGTSYRSAENLALNALKGWVDAVAAAIAATPPVPPPNKAAVAAATAIVDPLISNLTGSPFLSDVSKTR